MGVLGLFPWLSSSCFRAVEDVENELESESSNQPKTTLKLTTRSSTGTIDYPVMILAYDEDGNKSAQKILTSADDEVKLKLPVGSYRISALTGYESYVEPNDYSSSDAVIKVPTCGYSDEPLFVGSADVELSDKSASVDVIMSSRSASLQVSLKDLPSSVVATSVAIAKQYGALGMDGAYSSSVVTKVDCARSEDGIWSTGKVYLFPGAESQTVLTITITDDDQQYSYGYTVNEPLEAGSPYSLFGTYKGGERVESFDLSGSLIAESWKDPKTFNFEFGEGASHDNSVTEEGDIPSETVNVLPAELTLYDGHVIALLLNETATEADLLLVSLREYTNVYAAIASGHENDARNLAKAYVEGDMTGWSIPTNYEMQLLKAKYKDANLSNLNTAITQAGGTAISLYDDKQKAVRYLCEAALVANSFVSSSTQKSAGETVKYYLRFVKKVHVSLTE